MKKQILIYSVIIAVFVCFMSCENPIMKSWWEEQGITGDGVDNSNIVKVDPVVYWPDNLKVIYGLTLASIKMPINRGHNATQGTFTWTKISPINNPARKQTYEMTFTPYDTFRYNTVTDNVEITVITIDMIPIPAGTFMMGSPPFEPSRFYDEGPQQQVTMSSFLIGKYPVTQELYETVMNYIYQVNHDPVPGESETPDLLPVENVSWCNALEFCNKLSMMMGLSPAYRIPAFNNSTDPADWGNLPFDRRDEIAKAWNTAEIVPGSNGYRLPTEAQWEYACRAGTTTAYNTGADFDYDTGWSRENSKNTSHKVGLKKPNNWGLYDMHGGVSEYCWDTYNYCYTGTPKTDPVCEDTGEYRVMRGGGYYRAFWELRSATRSFCTLEFPYEGCGFRVVLP